MGRTRVPSIGIVKRWIKKGFGQGEGKGYKPFFQVRDVPSRGRSSKVRCLKTGRTHHYLSDGEYFHHILAEFEPSITDIREQYALLPWEETQEIAYELGITHPVYPGTQTPIVMTSNLVLSYCCNGVDRETVLSVKQSADLDPKDDPMDPQIQRTYEKLLIEKIYWQRRDITWCVSTEKNISLSRAKNLDSLRTSMVARELDWLQEYMNEFLISFNRYWNHSRTLNEIISAVAVDLKLGDYQSIILFGRAVWLRLLPVDLDSEIINHHYPVKRAPIIERSSLCLILV